MCEKTFKYNCVLPEHQLQKQSHSRSFAADERYVLRRERGTRTYSPIRHIPPSNIFPQTVGPGQFPLLLFYIVHDIFPSIITIRRSHGSGPRVVGRLGSGTPVSTSFKNSPLNAPFPA